MALLFRDRRYNLCCAGDGSRRMEVDGCGGRRKNMLGDYGPMTRWHEARERYSNPVQTGEKIFLVFS